jgi:hypothetical protein
MAVAETSTSCGKSSASGATRSTRSQRTRCPHRTEFQASNRHVAPVPIVQAAINSIAIATVQASKLLAQKNIMLAAQRNTYLVAAANLSNTTSQTNSNITSTSTILSMEDKTRADARLSSTAVGSELVAGNKIEVGIGNAALLSAAQLTAPSIAFTRAAGADTTTDAQLILDGAANTLQVSRTEKGDTLGLWQSATGAGKTEQTLTQTTLKGSTSFDPTLKISVTLPAGDLKTQLATLSSQPGMDYLAQLAQRDDVNWQGVKLAHDKWDYAHDGLTPAGAMVVAAVVAYFTAGAGSAAVGTASTTTATATTAAATTTTVGTTVLATTTAAGISYTAAGLAINAGFTALASQAAISMINTQGDIGKTLDQLGKEESIKNLVFTMLTAGALGSLSESLNLDQINAKSSFAANVGKNAITNLASASMDAALNGKPLNEDTLSKALSNALIAAGAAQGAHAIGDAASATMDSNGAMTPAKINAFTQSVAHALMGCAIGSASAGSGAGCSPGAVGAVVGELSAKFYNPDGKGNATDTVNFAKTMASLVGAMSGGGTQAVSIASMTGGNAAENNFCIYNDCTNRRFDWNDAVNQWRNGNGSTVTDVKASEINLTDATYTKNSNGTYQIHTSIKFDTGAIYGTVTGVLNADGTMSIKPDIYDFDLKNPFIAQTPQEFGRLILRDGLTAIGAGINGIGTPYRIEFSGSIPAPKELPK